MPAIGISKLTDIDAICDEDYAAGHQAFCTGIRFYSGASAAWRAGWRTAAGNHAADIVESDPIGTGECDQCHGHGALYVDEDDILDGACCRDCWLHCANQVKKYAAA